MPISSEGRIDVVLDPPVGSFEFTIRGPGFLPFRRIGWVGPAQWWLDLGHNRLRPAGKVEGCIIESDGKPVLRGWDVRLFTSGDARSGTFSPSAPLFDPRDGVFRFDAVPADLPLEVFAISRTGNRQIPSARVQVDQGGSAFVVLRVVDSDPARKIRIELSVSGLDVRSPKLTPRCLVLRDAAGEVARTLYCSDSEPTYEGVNLDPGPYEVYADDPGFEPGPLGTVSAGEKVTLEARGACRVLLSFRDDLGHELGVRGVALEAPDGTLFTPVHLRGDEARFEGLPAGSWTPVVALWGDAHVEEPWRGPALEVDPLGELRAVVVLPEHLPLTGIVVDAAGSPAAEIDVEVSRGRYAGMPETSIEFENDYEGSMTVGPPVVVVRTDALGRFVTPCLPRADYVVRAVLGPTCTGTRIVEKRLGHAEPLRLDLPPRGRLEVRFLGVPAYRLGELRLAVRPADNDTSYVRRFAYARALIPRLLEGAPTKEGRVEIPWKSAAAAPTEAEVIHASEPRDESHVVGVVRLEVEAGRALVLLWYLSDPDGKTVGVVRREHVRVESGAHRVVRLQATGAFPSTLSFRAGDVPPHCNWGLVRHGPNGLPDSKDPWEPALVPERRGSLAAGETEVVQPLQAGGTYSIVVIGPDEDWAWVCPTPVTAVQGLDHRLDFDFPGLIVAAPRLVDEEGGPLAGGMLFWRTQAPGSAERRVRLLPQALFRTKLPPGEVLLRVRSGRWTYLGRTAWPPEGDTIRLVRAN